MSAALLRGYHDYEMPISLASRGTRIVVTFTHVAIRLTALSYCIYTGKEDACADSAEAGFCPGVLTRGSESAHHGL